MNINRRKLIQGTASGAAIAALGSTASSQDLPTVNVASTNYTEQFILAELMVALLDDAGYSTNVEHNLGGTFVIHEAAVNGDVDVYVEYSGSGLTILEKDVADVREEGDSPDDVVEKVHEIVTADYAEHWDLHWLGNMGFNNTFAFAMRREDAEERGIVTISDLADVADELKLGGTQEFLIREDGMPGIEELYGFSFGDSTGMDSGLMYGALEQGDVDVISAFATDGRIQAMDFVLLEDDLGFFPPYYPAPIVRGELLEQSPEIRDALDKLAGELDNTIMQGLNYRVDNDGEEFRDVARSFLTEEGYIGGNP